MGGDCRQKISLDVVTLLGNEMSKSMTEWGQQEGNGRENTC